MHHVWPQALKGSAHSAVVQIRHPMLHVDANPNPNPNPNPSPNPNPNVRAGARTEVDAERLQVAATTWLGLG